MWAVAAAAPPPRHSSSTLRRTPPTTRTRTLTWPPAPRTTRRVPRNTWISSITSSRPRMAPPGREDAVRAGRRGQAWARSRRDWCPRPRLPLRRRRLLPLRLVLALPLRPRLLPPGWGPVAAAAHLPPPRPSPCRTRRAGVAPRRLRRLTLPWLQRPAVAHRRRLVARRVARRAQGRRRHRRARPPPLPSLLRPQRPRPLRT